MDEWPKNSRPTGGLIVVDIDALQLQVRVAVVAAGWVNAMLVGDHLPELYVIVK